MAVYPPPLTITPFSGSMVPQNVEDTRASLTVWLKDRNGQTLANASNKKFRVVITKDGRMIYIRNDLPLFPAHAGIWMDFPEKHWKISRYKYRKLPEEERARLEAEEQLRYAAKEFEQYWVETWFPDDYYSFWWYRGGAALCMHHPEKYKRYVQLLFRKGRDQLRSHDAHTQENRGPQRTH
jgi:hypothetical protein